MEKPSYLHWIVCEDAKIKNFFGNFNCYRIIPITDENVLEEWALHIRRHYISDEELLKDTSVLSLSIEEYLRNYKIPQKSDRLCSTARSNVLTEIIISDLVEFIYGYHVPRVRQYNLPNRTAPVQGTDVLGYKFVNKDYSPNPNDELLACEVKGILSTCDMSVIESSVKHSVKDQHRFALSLNFIRTKLKCMDRLDEAKQILRFQLKPVDGMDYKIKFIAAGMTNLNQMEQENENGGLINYLPTVDGSTLQISNDTDIFFVYGKDLLDLAHNIFERCIK